MPFRRVLLVAVALLAALAPAAHAGDVRIDAAAQTLVYTGDDGPNHIDVFVFDREDGSWDVRVRDFDGDSTTSSPEFCTVDSVEDVDCTLPFAPLQRLLLGGGDDNGQPDSEFRMTGNVVDGGPGNDELEGAEGGETLIGGPGDDSLSPDGGPNGGVVLAAGPGDVLIGGEGTDTADYFGNGGDGISLSIDGVANDGIPGEGDNITADVENITGPFYDGATLIGSDAPNVLEGARGGDVLIGRGGHDKLSGALGDDKLDGGAGDDDLHGGEASDELTGGPGRDAFTADGNALFGDDRIFARDGVAETISCGPGADTAVVDRIDLLPGDAGTGCEAVDRATVAVPPRLRGTALDAARGRVPLRVACAKGGPRCRGAARIQRKGRTLARGSYAVRAGRTATVRVRLTTAGRRALRTSRRVRATVRLDPAGAGPVVSRSVTLRR